MAKLPVVAIIGRPNTGKSTLFNRLVGRRRAIVSSVPGTTRDPVACRVEGEEVDYLLMDTGGMGGGSADEDFEDDVAAQSLIALEHADLLLFAVNGREELTAADYEVADALRKKRRRHVSVFLVVTKCDDPEKVEDAFTRFYELGIADRTFAVSAVHGFGTNELREGIEEELRGMGFLKKEQEEQKEEKEEKEVPGVAIVGRPNVGKSSIVNALMSEEDRRTRARLTGEEPGTTRDTTDTVIHSHGKSYLFLDTAGLRKKGRAGSEIEAYAVLRTLQAVEDADVTVLVLDATQDIGRQDKRIAGIAIECGSGLILLANKTDLIGAEERERFSREIIEAFPFCRWAPVLFTSAVTRENLPKIFDLVTNVCANRQRRIATPAMNRWYQGVIAEHRPDAKYVTQVDAAPPTFALFLRDPKRLNHSSLRFMERKLREAYALDGTPVRWVKRAH